MESHTIIKGIVSVMDVELGVDGISALQRKNGASLVNELAAQDIRIRTTTTLIDSMICCFANRSHGQRIVVVENELMEI